MLLLYKLIMTPAIILSFVHVISINHVTPTIILSIDVNAISINRVTSTIILSIDVNAIIINHVTSISFFQLMLMSLV